MPIALPANGQSVSPVATCEVILLQQKPSSEFLIWYINHMYLLICWNKLSSKGPTIDSGVCRYKSINFELRYLLLYNSNAYNFSRSLPHQRRCHIRESSTVAVFLYIQWRTRLVNRGAGGESPQGISAIHPRYSGNSVSAL